eukprot:1159881-Pelagomonas_calceolata.AAC.8
MMGLPCHRAVATSGGRTEGARPNTRDKQQQHDAVTIHPRCSHAGCPPQSPCDDWQCGTGTGHCVTRQHGCVTWYCITWQRGCSSAGAALPQGSSYIRRQNREGHAGDHKEGTNELRGMEPAYTEADADA